MARELLRRHLEVKKQLWGGGFWSGGCFSSTVGKHGYESVTANYVKNQGQSYNQLYYVS